MLNRTFFLLLVVFTLLLAGCQSGQAVSEGGRLYDNWWAEKGSSAPTSDQPLWANQTSNERSGDTTWRCKECHGWDYLGKDGAYSSGSHYTGFVGVLQSKDRTESELVAIISGETNADHDFSTVLSGSDMKKLATFLREGMLDMRPFIDGEGNVKGDAVEGERLYGNGCVGCHGEQGNEMLTEDPEDEVVILGELASDNPWEVYHKAMFGQPGKPKMLSGKKLNWSAQDVTHLLAYLQSLPKE